MYFRQDGSPCSLELEERTIAADGDAMRRTALRVGVGWGAAKALPSIGAIRAGLINTLVTDEECARTMLAITAERDRGIWPCRQDSGRRARGLLADFVRTGEMVNSVKPVHDAPDRREEMDIDLAVEAIVGAATRLDEA